MGSCEVVLGFVRAIVLALKQRLVAPCPFAKHGRRICQFATALCTALAQHPELASFPPSLPPSLPPSPSLLNSFIPIVFAFFLPSVLPAFLLSALPSFLHHSFLASFIPLCFPSFVRSLLPSVPFFLEAHENVMTLDASFKWQYECSTRGHTFKPKYKDTARDDMKSRTLHARARLGSKMRKPENHDPSTFSSEV